MSARVDQGPDGDGVAAPARADASTGRRSPFGRLYGASPWHLLALLLCFALTAYTVALVLDEAGLPVVVKIGIWFVGAALAWDLVLGPLLAAADRLLLPLRRAGALNHVRVPLLGSALLLLVWAPVVLQRSEDVFRTKAGLGQDPFLVRWLVITAVLCAASALHYAVRTRRRRAADTEVIQGSAGPHAG